jgi:hypothetical protein
MDLLIAFVIASILYIFGNKVAEIDDGLRGTTGAILIYFSGVIMGFFITLHKFN